MQNLQLTAMEDHKRIRPFIAKPGLALHLCRQTRQIAIKMLANIIRVIM